MKRKIFTTLALAFSAAVCFAALDLSGKWSGNLKTPDGNEFPLSYTFKVDGDKLTGTVSSPMGDLPLDNGTVKGDSIFFSIDVNGDAIPNKGKCYPDSISLSSVYNGQTNHLLLKQDK